MVKIPKTQFSSVWVFINQLMLETLLLPQLFLDFWFNFFFFPFFNIYHVTISLFINKKNLTWMDKAYKLQFKIFDCFQSGLSYTISIMCGSFRGELISTIKNLFYSLFLESSNRNNNVSLCY